MSTISVPVLREKKNLVYVMDGHKVRFKPLLNPQVYPRYSVEQLAEKLMTDVKADSFEIVYHTPNDWQVDLYKS